MEQWGQGSDTEVWYKQKVTALLIYAIFSNIAPRKEEHR